MEISRNIILDLLPLYIADEASPETRDLVEQYLENDPDLATIAQKLSASELLKEVPIPITKEHEMEAYEEAKLQQRRYIITLVAVISVIILFMMAAELIGLFLLIPRIWSTMAAATPARWKCQKPSPIRTPTLPTPMSIRISAKSLRLATKT